MAFTVGVRAEPQEFARLVRNGEQATLSAFGPRPVDLAAGKLVEDFGVAINVEDPVYLYRDDVEEVGPGTSGRRLLIPKSSLLEIAILLRPDGSLSDTRQVVQELADTANRQLSFEYRIDAAGGAFSLVPTSARDEKGRSVRVTPILDRHVTIPLGTRKVYEHVILLAESLQRQTGFRISCCQAGVVGRPWGDTLVSFEANDESARTALLRLLRSEPGRDRLGRSAQGETYHLVKSEPDREHWRWTMRCQPGEAWCFINVSAVPEKP